MPMISDDFLYKNYVVKASLYHQDYARLLVTDVATTKQEILLTETTLKGQKMKFRFKVAGIVH